MEIVTRKRSYETNNSSVEQMKVLGMIASLPVTEELVCSGVDDVKRLQRFILDSKKKVPSFKDVRTKVIGKDRLIVFRQEPNEG